MTIAEEYLKKLQEREPQLFPEPLRKSALTDGDIIEIERALGHRLPEQYKEFLQSYQLPETMTVYISFCGDSYANSFSDTFSREKNEYVPVDWDNDLSTLVDMEWQNFNASNAAEWLKQLEDVDLAVASACLEAGYIYLGMFYEESYYVLYDLVKGEVVDIHHEAVYDLSYELGDVWEGGMPETLREGMVTYGHTLCKNFNDYLRLVCTGEHYDEDDMVFVKEEDLEDY